LILDRFEEFEHQTTGLLLHIARADSYKISPKMRDVGLELQASCVVRCAAQVERLFRGCLEDVETGIGASSITVASLTPGLRGYLGQGCRSNLSRVPSRTLRVLDVVSPQHPVNSAAVALGEIAGEGVTIRPHHFLLVWSLFSLPGSPLTVRGQVALTAIANYRNWIAHGEENPKTLNDVLVAKGDDLHRTIMNVQDIAGNLVIGLDDFVTGLP
jgi:hypothetical protein